LVKFLFHKQKKRKRNIQKKKTKTIGIGCGELSVLHLGGIESSWEFFPAGPVFNQLHDPGN